MKTARHCFNPNLLRLAIAASLIGPGIGLASPALQPAPGPGGTPTINPHNGVPVIDIVAPNASGLSHNQFLDYNVGKPGAVLNNALQPGQSQLAGQLGANPQLQGQAASTILNEVISRNASIIEGPQEIFGRPADYILANPNGITINGGTFINTTKAGLIVGRPVIEDGRLSQFDNLDSNAQLKVGERGLANVEGALALIAPKIESAGLLDAKGDLEVIAGRNRIDVASGQVFEHRPGTPGSIDANLFGAMRAGQIRIISTAEGAGVRIAPPSMSARDGISVDSAGDLDIAGSARRQSRIDAGTGELKLNAAANLRLSAVDASAARVEGRAGKRLVLDSKTREKISRENQSDKKKWWFVTTETYDRQRTTTERKDLGSQLVASGAIDLKAGEDLQIRNAKVKARDDLSIDAGGRLDIGAGLQSVHVDETIRHRKHLWRGDKDSREYRETALPSELSAGKLKLEAGTHMRVEGSTLRSGKDLTVKAPHLEVTTAQQNSSDTSKQYSGDLVSGSFFGKRDGSEGGDTRNLGSQMISGGALTVVADQVQVSGSRIASKDDALLASQKATLTVEAAHDTRQHSTRHSDSKVFGLVSNSSDSQQRSDSVLTSDVTSDSNLRLASADELRVIGSRLKAGDKLQLEAAKDLNLSAAKESQQINTQETRRGFYANARETVLAADGKPGSKQYNAAAGYQLTSKDNTSSQTTLVPSQLDAGSIEVTGKSRVAIDSSRLNANQGAIDISGAQVSLGAQSNQRQQSSTDTRFGGGIAATGGMDRIGTGPEGFHHQQVREQTSIDPLSSELKATGDIRVNTSDLVNEAAKVEAGGELLVDAPQVDNRATAKVEEVRESNREWNGRAGLSLEIKDLTRPIENVVNGNEAARFQQASVEDALAPPTLGVDLSLDHLKREQTRRSETANVSELSAGVVKVKADSLNDNGTRYSASNGKVHIDAKHHQFSAAQDSVSEAVQRLDVSGAARVETATGKDIAVRLSGKGGSLDSTTQSITAQPGSLYGQQGIQVQLGSDGLYEGTRFDGGKGAVTVDAAGDLTLAQANDRQQSSLRQTDGSGWVKAGTTPGGKALELRGYLDHKRLDSRDSQARVASIDAQGAVQLTSGGKMTLAGTRIGDPQNKPTDITLDAQGPLQVLAATDTHSASGSNLGGGGEVQVRNGGAGAGGGLGGHFETGRIDEQSSKATAAVLTAKDSLNFTSQDGSDQAIHLQGVKASAKEVMVTAENGGVLVESAQDTEKRDNLKLTAGAGFSKTPAEAKADNKSALHGRALVNLDQLDALHHLNSELNGQRVGLNSLNDMQLKGVRVNAGAIDGQIGGDLLVASQMDRIKGLKIDVDARLSQEKNPQGYLNAVKSFSGPLAAKAEKSVGSTVQKIDPGFSPTLDLKVDHRQLDSVAEPSRLVGRDGLALEVAGDVRLSGADLRAPKGDVELGSGHVSKQTLSGRDYRRVVGTNLSNAPVELGQDLVNTYKESAMGLEDGDASVDLGLFRTGGHDREVSVGSNVTSKKGQH